MAMTHYETLGVGDKATADEIKKAYRKLASQHHPDKGGDTAKFQEIQTAYDILSDQQKRERYDLERQGGGFRQFNFGTHGTGHPDIDAIFKNFGFGNMDPFARHQPRRNKDLRVEVNLTLADTLVPHTKTISVQTTTGHRETVEVQIPRGVTSGMQIKYAGLGDNLFESLDRGDLYVQITVYDSADFKFDGIDLYSRLSVNCLLAMTGGPATITGLDGKVFELTVPPGTQPGTKFRVAGHGLYRLHSERRGDLYVTLEVTIPKNLTPEQLEIVQNLNNSFKL
jgi:DnaJ-class molecular chaperone